MKVWIALGGTVMRSPAEASVWPSGVTNRIVPVEQFFSGKLLDDRESPRLTWKIRVWFHTFGHEKQFVMKSVPVHGRARLSWRNLDEHAADPVLSQRTIFIDSDGQWSDFESLGRFSLGQFDGNGASRSHPVSV